MTEIDWNSEAMKMAMDYMDWSWDHSHGEAIGYAEYRCAKRLGWA